MKMGGGRLRNEVGCTVLPSAISGSSGGYPWLITLKSLEVDGNGKGFEVSKPVRRLQTSEL